MKKLSQVLNSLEEIQAKDSASGRVMLRLSVFIPKEFLHKIIGFPPQQKWQPVEWTRENILEKLQNDVVLGFHHALEGNGDAARDAFSVVKMWNRILEEGLEDHCEEDEEYTHFGLPHFKATAEKYGWWNPIGEDLGCEMKYAELIDAD